MGITDLIITRLAYYEEVLIYPQKLRFYSLTADAGYTVYP